MIDSSIKIKHQNLTFTVTKMIKKVKVWVERENRITEKELSKRIEF